jgi:MFS family permease
MERKWWTLAGTCAGLFLLMLDSTVVALALPSIRDDVGASSQGLQWVMNGFTWTFVRDVDPPKHDPQHRHSHL